MDVARKKCFLRKLISIYFQGLYMDIILPVKGKK